MVKQKLRVIKLKRFGRIIENPSWDFKKTYWSVKYGNDFDEPKDSGIIMRVSFDQKDYPDKNKLPLYKEVEMRWKQ